MKTIEYLITIVLFLAMPIGALASDNWPTCPNPGVIRNVLQASGDALRTNNGLGWFLLGNSFASNNHTWKGIVGYLTASSEDAARKEAQKAIAKTRGTPVENSSVDVDWGQVYSCTYDASTETSPHAVVVVMTPPPPISSITSAMLKAWSAR